MDLLTVLTCPRKHSYLKPTLASLDAAGASLCDRWVYSDGPLMDELPEGWCAVSSNAEPQGNLSAFFVTLKLFLANNFARLLYFEDDVVLCRNAIERMQKVGVADHCAFTTFFDMKEIPSGGPWGQWQMPTTGLDGRGFWGMQAVMFPRRTAEWLVAHETSIRERMPRAKHQADYLIGCELLRSPWPSFQVHVPNLVQHVGEVSAVNQVAKTWNDYRVNRRSTSFPGVEFDASTLP